MSDLPHRPRLAEHAQLRRHLVDGALRLMLLDAHSDEGYELEERDVELLLCADGTRDVGGVMLEVQAVDFGELELGDAEEVLVSTEPGSRLDLAARASVAFVDERMGGSAHLGLRFLQIESRCEAGLVELMSDAG